MLCFWRSWHVQLAEFPSQSAVMRFAWNTVVLVLLAFILDFVNVASIEELEHLLSLLLIFLLRS